jgi:hypothetical protein
MPDKEISLGPVRHRLCEPLFKGKGKGGESIWEGVGRAVESGTLRDWEKKAVWEGIGIVGELAKFRCEYKTLTKGGLSADKWGHSIWTGFIKLSHAILTG